MKRTYNYKALSPQMRADLLNKFVRPLQGEDELVELWAFFAVMAARAEALAAKAARNSHV